MPIIINFKFSLNKEKKIALFLRLKLHSFVTLSINVNNTIIEIVLSYQFKMFFFISTLRNWRSSSIFYNNIYQSTITKGWSKFIDCSYKYLRVICLPLSAVTISLKYFTRLRTFLSGTETNVLCKSCRILPSIPSERMVWADLVWLFQRHDPTAMD